MCYRGGRGVVPTDESTSIRNCGDAYDGIRPGRMIVKFRGWPCRCVCGILVWQNHHIKGTLCHVKCHWGNVIQAWPNTEIHDMSGKHLPITASFIVR